MLPITLIFIQTRELGVVSEMFRASSHGTLMGPGTRVSYQISKLLVLYNKCLKVD